MGGLLVAGRPAPARAAGVTPRVFGTALQSEAAVTDRAFAQTKVALVAAAVGFGVYVVGFIASFWPPEPPTGELDQVARDAWR